MLRMFSRKSRFTGALVFAAIALSWGLSWAETKVVFIHGAEPKSLDNALHPAGSADLNVQTSLYDSLTFHRLDGKIEGRLATSWSFKNPTTIVFKLRKGVKFHDGTPFNAAAVKFSLDRTRGHKRARLRKWIAMIKEITVIDDHTVEMELKYPFAPILLNLGTPVAAIGSPTAIKKHGKNFRRNPVGTGPFIFEKWVAGEYIRFRANPDYWTGNPKSTFWSFGWFPKPRRGFSSFAPARPSWPCSCPLRSWAKWTRTPSSTS